MTANDLEISIDAAAKQRAKRYRVIKFVMIVVCAIIGYFAFNIYKFSTHPLVGGIAPRFNSDGTTDYTLVQIRRKLENQGKDEYSELVVRMPSKAAVYGIKDNRRLSFTASFDDLTYRNFEYTPKDSEERTDQSLVEVFFSGNYVIDRNDGFADLLDRECVATGQKIGGLEEYMPKPDEKSASYCKDNGYVLWADTTKKRYRAHIECNKDEGQKHPNCKYYFARGDDNVWGDYPSSRLAEAKDFFDRLDGFLKKAIVHEGRLYDRPFVWN